MRRLGNQFYRLLYLSVGEDEFNLHLGQKIHGVFASAINLRVTLLAAEALYFRHRHAGHANLG